MLRMHEIKDRFTKKFNLIRSSSILIYVDMHASSRVVTRCFTNKTRVRIFMLILKFKYQSDMCMCRVCVCGSAFI